MKEQPKSRESGIERKIVYAFLSLPYHKQIKILQELAVYDSMDHTLPVPDRWKEPFKKINEMGLTSDLWEKAKPEEEISRVSGEPPKPDHYTLEDIKNAWYGGQNWYIGELEEDRGERDNNNENLDQLISKLKKLSGEAKTLDQPIILPKTCLDVFKNISGHLTYSETAALIQFLKEKQMPKGIELTGGSVPTPRDVYKDWGTKNPTINKFLFENHRHDASGSIVYDEATVFKLIELCGAQ